MIFNRPDIIQSMIKCSTGKSTRYSLDMVFFKNGYAHTTDGKIVCTLKNAYSFSEKEQHLKEFGIIINSNQINKNTVKCEIQNTNAILINYRSKKQSICPFFPMENHSYTGHDEGGKITLAQLFPPIEKIIPREFKKAVPAKAPTAAVMAKVQIEFSKYSYESNSPIWYCDNEGNIKINVLIHDIPNLLVVGFGCTEPTNTNFTERINKMLVYP